MNKRTRYRIKRFTLFFFLLLLLIVFLSPVYWVTITSFKRAVDISEKVTYIIGIDFKPVLHAWKYVFFGPVTVVKSFKDSFIISLFSATIALILGTMAGYGLSRFNYSFNTHILGHWHSKEIAFWFISQWMMPPIAIVFPFILMYKALHLLDVHLGLIIVYLTFNIPFTVWIMRNFFNEIPKEIEESAMIDGCSRWKIFLLISIPLAAPGLVVTFIFNFIFSWNEFLFSLILTFWRVRPFPLLIASEVTQVGIRWWNMSAIALISSLPAIIMGPLLSRFLVRGIISDLK